MTTPKVISYFLQIKVWWRRRFSYCTLETPAR